MRPFGKNLFRASLDWVQVHNLGRSINCASNTVKRPHDSARPTFVHCNPT